MTVLDKTVDTMQRVSNMKDVFLMIELGFTPETWRHWRSKLIEFLEDVEYTKIDSDGKEKIVYDKKQKLWTKQDV